MAELVNLTDLSLDNNSVSDLSPLSRLTSLWRVRLAGNNISDISPLTANTGLDGGDTVNVQGNPLSYQSIHTHIPILQSKGVTVKFDNRAHPALLKISGDNQKGASFTPLSQPFVVEAQDAKGSVLAGVSVTFAVTAGGGARSVPQSQEPMKTAEHRVYSRWAPNLGTNTVRGLCRWN